MVEKCDRESTQVAENQAKGQIGIGWNALACLYCGGGTKFFVFLNSGGRASIG